jgi:hypothetical protein
MHQVLAGSKGVLSACEGSGKREEGIKRMIENVRTQFEFCGLRDLLKLFCLNK